MAADRPNRLIDAIAYNADPGDINEIPDAAPPQNEGRMSIELGYDPIMKEPVVSGGLPPLMNDINGALNLITKFSIFYQAGGKFIWTASEPKYIVGSEILGSDGLIYICVQENGDDSTTQDPTLDTTETYWRKGVNLAASQTTVDAGLDVQEAVTSLTLANRLSGAILDYSATVNYALKSHTVGTDGNIYNCRIVNGPASSVVNPVGDTSSTWVQDDTSDAQSISGTVAGNNLTVGLKAKKLNFRNSTLTNGVYENISFEDLSLVIPDGATLGTVSAIESELIVIAINNGGTVELAIVNVAGGNDLSETGLITTVAIDSTADSASVFYSETARTGVAYRVVGSVKSTQVTAGVWASTPSAVQGVGGNALTAMSSLGYGQTWQTVTRASGVTYYNTTGKPIVLKFVMGDLTNVDVEINGYAFSTDIATNQGVPATYIIPVGASYSLTLLSGSLRSPISELR